MVLNRFCSEPAAASPALLPPEHSSIGQFLESLVFLSNLTVFGRSVSLPEQKLQLHTRLNPSSPKESSS